MAGVSAGRFAPEGTLTRAMLATVLYRAEGMPAVSAALRYTDVPAGSWYADAVLWASGTGLLQGYGNGYFGPNDPVSVEMLDVIIKEGKQRQDSIEQYRAANRADLADKEAAELKILQEYLPKALSPEELTAVIETTVAELQAAGPKDMGRVISAIMGSYKGRVDGKALSEAVKQRLAQ